MAAERKEEREQQAPRRRGVTEADVCTTARNAAQTRACRCARLALRVVFLPPRFLLLHLLRRRNTVASRSAPAAAITARVQAPALVLVAAAPLGIGGAAGVQQSQSHPSTAPAHLFQLHLAHHSIELEWSGKGEKREISAGGLSRGVYWPLPLHTSSSCSSRQRRSAPYPNPRRVCPPASASPLLLRAPPCWGVWRECGVTHVHDAVGHRPQPVERNVH